MAYARSGSESLARACTAETGAWNVTPRTSVVVLATEIAVATVPAADASSSAAHCRGRQLLVVSMKWADWDADDANGMADAMVL